MQNYIKSYITPEPLNGRVAPRQISVETTTPAPSAPAQRRRARPANLAKRGRVWYFTMSRDGQRFSQSLDTPDRAVAVARARDFAAAKAGRWKDMDGVRKPVKYAVLGEVFAALRAGAVVLGLREHTVLGYCQQLANVARQALGVVEVDKISTAVLTSTSFH